ncbi:MAG: hypothetical protein PHR16_04610 [Methylovulum sp.]|nr:hypothetical protein [Methylovulum sp.]
MSRITNQRARSLRGCAVADVLTPSQGQSYNTLREMFRDTYREAGAKSGGQRAELKAIDCWAPWLCRAGCLESLKSRGEARVETGMFGIVETVPEPIAR